jgi:MFS family permease
MFGLAAIPAVLLFAGMLFQQESPAWLVTRGREDEARAVLARVRDPGDIDAEIAEVRGVSQRQSGVRELLAPKVRPLLMVGVLLAVFQQITGINTIIYYAPSLLQGAGFGNSGALLANVVNGAIKIRGAAMSVATMANWGANFIVTISFLTLLNAVGGVGTFFLFGFLTLVALTYFWRKVPETKGRSLQEIERDLAVEPEAVEAVPAAGH